MDTQSGHTKSGFDYEDMFVFDPHGHFPDLRGTVDALTDVFDYKSELFLSLATTCLFSIQMDAFQIRGDLWTHNVLTTLSKHVCFDPDGHFPD